MRLARRLHFEWMDADNELEKRADRTIKEIFASDGEPVFRRMEREVIVSLLRRKRLVLSTGGGCVMNADTRRDLKAAGPVVWLQASVETIASRILHDSSTKSRRPNLTAVGGVEEIKSLLALREPMYRECASIIIDTDGLTFEAIVGRIVAQLPVEYTSASGSASVKEMPQ